MFEGAHRGHQHHAGGLKPRGPALDVHEFLSAQIRAEARLGDQIIAQFEAQAGGAHRVAAVGDVGKGAAVHQGGRVFQRLHQVGLEGVFEQSRQRALHLEIGSVNRAPVGSIGNQDTAQTVLEIGNAGGQAQNGHDFAGHRDLETVLPGHAVGLAAQADDDIPQGAVVHVHAALKENPAGIDSQKVALLQMVVDDGAQQIVGGGNGVQIAGKMQVDVFHGNDLRITAARGTALDAENRAQRRLAQCDDRLMAQSVESHSKAHGGGGFSLARWRRVDGRDKDELAVGSVLQAFFDAVGDFCLVLSVRLQFLRSDACFLGDLKNGEHRGLLGDFNVCQHRCSSSRMIV